MNMLKLLNLFLYLIFVNLCTGSEYKKAYDYYCNNGTNNSYDNYEVHESIIAKIGITESQILGSQLLFDLSKEIFMDNLEFKQINSNNFKLLKDFSSDLFDKSIINHNKFYAMPSFSIYNKIKFIPAIFGFLIKDDINHYLSISNCPRGYKNLSPAQINFIKNLEKIGKNSTGTISKQDLSKMLNISYFDLINVLESFDLCVYHQLMRIFCISYQDQDLNNKKSFNLSDKKTHCVIL